MVTPNFFIPKFRPVEDRAAWEALERNIRLGIGAEKVMQRQEMKKIADNEKLQKRKNVNGLGHLQMIIPARTYMRWQLEQEGCWSDKQFGAEFYRDNPELRGAKVEKRFY